MGAIFICAGGENADFSLVTALTSDVLSPKVFIDKDENIRTGSITTLAGGTYTASASKQVISCSGKKMTSNIIINPASGVANLKAANIKKGVKIGDVTGTFSGYVAEGGYIYKLGSLGNLTNGFTAIRYYDTRNEGR